MSTRARKTKKVVDPKADLYPHCAFEVRVNGKTTYANPAVNRQVAEKIAAQIEADGDIATIHEKTGT